jgi:hypothetical protein
MQFLVFLIEQAPGRVAEERERLEKLMAAAIENISRMSASSESYHVALQRKLNQLPANIADGIQPEAVAAAINEALRQEFIRSTIPQTSEALFEVSDRMKKVCSEFAMTSDSLGSIYRGAAEDARKAVASLNAEISTATQTATRLATALPEKFSKAYRWSLWMIAAGAFVIGLAFGMIFERWLFFPPIQAPPAAAPAPAPEVQADPDTAQKTPAAPKAKTKNTTSNSPAASH